MNIYEVILCTNHHYGNGHIERENEQPRRVLAKDGESAVKKAKKEIAYSEPTLEGLKLVMSDVS